MKGVRGRVERRRGVCVGIETVGPLTERNERGHKKVKSLRISVHHADAVVWGQV